MGREKGVSTAGLNNTSTQTRTGRIKKKKKKKKKKNPKNKRIRARANSHRRGVGAVEETVLQQERRAVAEKRVTLHLAKTHTAVTFAALARRDIAGVRRVKETTGALRNTSTPTLTG